MPRRSIRPDAFHPFEDLPDDGLGIETLGVGIERILLQPGYQTIIIRREHSVTP